MENKVRLRRAKLQAENYRTALATSERWGWPFLT